MFMGGRSPSHREHRLKRGVVRPRACCTSGKCIMASPYSTPSHAVIVSPYANEEPMPAGATGTLFLLASGFGIGALVILFAFVFLIGIGGAGHNATSGQRRRSSPPQRRPRRPDPRPIRRRTRAAARCRKRQVRRPHRPIPARRAHRPRDRNKTLSGHSGRALRAVPESRNAFTYATGFRVTTCGHPRNASEGLSDWTLLSSDPETSSFSDIAVIFR